MDNYGWITIYFSFVRSGIGDASKFVGLSYAELMQCVGAQNFRHSWDSALDSYPLAAHCVLPAPSIKQSDKVDK